MGGIDLIGIIIARKGNVLGFLELHLVLGDLGTVKLNLRGLEGDLLNELEGRLVAELAGQPKVRLLEVVVGLGGDVVVLEVLLSVEGDLLGLHLTLTNINLVTAQHDGDVVAHTGQILVPGGDVFVGLPVGDIEHDDTSLTQDVVAITETTEPLLTSSIPAVEPDDTTVGTEVKRMDLNTKSGNILLLELSGLVALHEAGLTDTTISDQNKLESLRRFVSVHLECCGLAWNKEKKKVWNFCDATPSADVYKGPFGDSNPGCELFYQR